VHLRIPGTKWTTTIATNNWREDARLTLGYGALKSKLILDQGARKHLVGWKLGFGSPTGLANLDIKAPLVGYLLAQNALENGATIETLGWVKPVGETEIAVYFARDIPPGSSMEFVMESISSIGPAIEIADLEFAPTDPTRILASDIFQRNYILGEADCSRAGGNIDGLEAHILMPDGSEVHVVELEALIGPLPQIITHCAEVVGDFSGGIKAGEFIIVGSIVPPIALIAGSHLKYRLGNYQVLELYF